MNRSTLTTVLFCVNLTFGAAAFAQGAYPIKTSLVDLRLVPVVPRTSATNPRVSSRQS